MRSYFQRQSNHMRHCVLLLRFHGHFINSYPPPHTYKTPDSINPTEFTHLVTPLFRPNLIEWRHWRHDDSFISGLLSIFLETNSSTFRQFSVSFESTNVDTRPVLDYWMGFVATRTLSYPFICSERRLEHARPHPRFSSVCEYCRLRLWSLDRKCLIWVRGCRKWVWLNERRVI